MAPEQAKGMAVDKRADIWAFGVVLYEMLTGARLFAGDSTAEILAEVLKRDIDLEQLPDTTPPALRRLVRRCLERNPRNRLHDIADARIVIDEIAGGGVEETATAPGAQGKRRPAGWLVATALVAGLALGALLVRALVRSSRRFRRP
jgi:hypothetical protein